MYRKTRIHTLYARWTDVLCNRWAKWQYFAVFSNGHRPSWGHCKNSALLYDDYMNQIIKTTEHCTHRSNNECIMFFHFLVLNNIINVKRSINRSIILFSTFLQGISNANVICIIACIFITKDRVLVELKSNHAGKYKVFFAGMQLYCGQIHIPAYASIGGFFPSNIFNILKLHII